MIYVRGNKRDFDTWASMGNKCWDYESVLPFFKKSEANHFLPFVYECNGRYHNASGLLNIDFYGSSQFSKIFTDAAIEKGIPYINDINAGQTIGYVNSQGTCYQGRRQSTASAFLVSAKERKNLRIVKYGLVKKIYIDNTNRAYGIEYIRNGKTLKAYNNREVILSGGSLMSPVVLMLSGIGPKEQLETNNIPKKKYLAVGENLSDHINIMIFFQFDPTPTDPFNTYDATYNLAVHNSGELTNVGVSSLCGFINTNKTSEFPNIELMHIWLSQNQGQFFAFQYKEEIAQKIMNVTTNYDIGGIMVILLKPESRGYVHLNGTSIYNKPHINPQYFSKKKDLETITAAIRQQISFTETQSFWNKRGEYLRLPIAECDKFEFDSDEYWGCYISYMSQTIYHPVGTCKMGPKTDPNAVVDERLRVYGIDKLRVIDASM